MWVCHAAYGLPWAAQVPYGYSPLLAAHPDTLRWVAQADALACCGFPALLAETIRACPGQSGGRCQAPSLLPAAVVPHPFSACRSTP
jgi:hypothetical protein